MKSRRILVVEDNAAARETIRELLGDEGYEVEVAGDGLEALDRLDDAPVDLVVTDLHMPRLDGAGLLARLRVSAPDTPVLLMTADRAADDGPEPPEVQAQGYLHKPIDLDHLLAEIARLLLR